MADPKEDPQSKLWDRTIELPEMVMHIRVMQENRAGAKAFAKAKGKVSKLFDTLECSDGDRVRIVNPAKPEESYVIEARGRSGGGITVPQWKKVTPGKVTAL